MTRLTFVQVLTLIVIKLRVGISRPALKERCLRGKCPYLGGIETLLLRRGAFSKFGLTVFGGGM